MKTETAKWLPVTRHIAVEPEDSGAASQTGRAGGGSSTTAVKHGRLYDAG